MALRTPDAYTYNLARRSGIAVLRRFASHFDEMALALVLWLCTLPLVGLFIMPFFGLKVAVLAAIMLFFVAMIVCWGICSWKIFRS